MRAAAMMRMLGVCAAMVVLAAGCGGGDDTPSPTATTSTASSDATGLRVTSSLQGKDALPHRIGWTATVNAPAAKVAKVEFLVDRQVAWVEQKPPYAFDDDGGYLVTSWIKPGMRNFTVRATTTDGRTASTSSRAQVTAAPAPPATLAGTWIRNVSDTSAAPPPGSAGNPTNTPTPPGTYELHLDRVQAQTRFPGTFSPTASADSGRGFILDADYATGPSTLVAGGGVTKRPFDDANAEGGWWCTNTGPTSTYRWRVAGSTLTLQPEHGSDGCGVRGFIWIGTWRRRPG